MVLLIISSYRGQYKMLLAYTYTNSIRLKFIVGIVPDGAMPQYRPQALQAEYRVPAR